MMTRADRVSRRLNALRQEVSLSFPHKMPKASRVDVIVSLTSFPARIGTTWKTLESIDRQSMRPMKIVLVLSEAEFPGRVLPASVTKRDVEILWVEENSRSYKKLLPTMEKYPHQTIVTADDDVIYPSWWLERLLRDHSLMPRTILGLRGAMITRRGAELDPYHRWPGAMTTTKFPLLKGDAGILYPAEVLPPVAFDANLARELCPTADDIWFWACAVHAGVQIRRTMDGPFDVPTVSKSQRASLRALNVGGGGNDEQFERVISWFGLDANEFAVEAEER